MSRCRRDLWTLLLLTALGAGYGFVSFTQNRNPYYESGAPPAPLGVAWGWRPSPVWLPSYLLCVVPTNGYGISWTRSGYLFRNEDARRRYASASVALGAAMGALAAASGIGARALVGSYRLRRRGTAAGPAE